MGRLHWVSANRDLNRGTGLSEPPKQTSSLQHVIFVEIT